jgi:hypothetical protein
MTQPEPEQQPAAEPEQPEPVKKAEPQPPPGPPEVRSPIVGERQVGRFEFLYRRLPVTARLARVLVTSSGRRVVYGPGKQPTTGELLWGGVRMVYDVDLGSHVTQIVAAPPSRGDKIAFRADIDVIWHVTDASAVVLAGVDDVRRITAPSLLCRLRAVTRRYEIADSKIAEEAANHELRNSTVGADLGLSLEVFIRLAMDEPTLNQAEIQREVDHFRKIIAAGDFNQFALQLAVKPGDVGTVVKMLADERDSHRKAVFNFVSRLLESDALDRWQIDDQVRTTLQWLRDSSHKVLAGTDEIRKFSYGENHREQASHTDNGSSPP